MKPPPTRYAKSGELNIAYQACGDGPIDLVFIPGALSHLDLNWEDPNRMLAMERWASFARVLIFDKRNTGLSDRTAASPTIEERMDDIRAVMDDAGSESAALFGNSEGGPLAILFAATYPERVHSLVLGSTYARPVMPPDLELQLEWIGRAWGSGAVMRMFDPSCSPDWAARYERSSASPRVAVETLRQNACIDVSSALSAIHVPTLVFHRRGDPIVPVERGRELAAAIAGAAYIEYEGDGHTAANEAEWEQQASDVEEFLTGSVRSREPDRVLATVLFTDIVASTERAADMGDGRWRLAIERHQQETARLVEQFRGRQVKSTGDGVLATFDGPARAVRCAAALTARGEKLGLPIRAGLHTGEVELLADDIAGIAVHLAKRVESAAAPGTVWVSQTVRDLVTGSGIEFSERGTHDLKGVPGEWRLYEVLAT